VKFLLRLFERNRYRFEEGRRLARYGCIFEALEGFFFGDSTATLGAPHVRDPIDIKRFMSMVIVGLVPSLACALYFFGLRLVAMILVSYVVGGIVEVAFAMIRKEGINEGFLVTGMLFPMILPPTTPLWMVALGVAFGVFVGKELFGGTGRNLFNPALLGRCFLFLAYPSALSSNWVKPGSGVSGRIFEFVMPSNVDAMSQATPLALARQGQAGSIDVINLFLGNVSGSIAETSALAIILGGIFLLLTRVASWRSVAGTLASAAVCAAVLHFRDPERFAPVLWNLCAGGLLFAAFFMVTDPITSPATNGGKWIYGLIIGSATIMIRNFTGYVEGVTFAVLLGNIVAPVLDEIVVYMRLRRLQYES